MDFVKCQISNNICRNLNYLTPYKLINMQLLNKIKLCSVKFDLFYNSTEIVSPRLIGLSVKLDSCNASKREKMYSNNNCQFISKKQT